MTIPTMTVTMLGDTGSGKSTFMLGMYAILSAGLSGYFVYTKDPDDDLELSDKWEALYEGHLPQANLADDMKAYKFVFTRGLEPLVEIDWMDYRGGAIADDKAKEDVDQLLGRLARSDSIYLVVDGEKAGAWIKGIRDAAKAGDGRKVNIDRVRGKLKINRMTILLQPILDARRSPGRDMPSFVLLITKLDALAAVAGTKKSEAFSTFMAHLRGLMPFLFVPGITALVCPVQIGNFGAGSAEKGIQPDSLDPVGLQKPFIFTLMRYLTAEVSRRDAEIRSMRDRSSSAAAELEKLRGGFWSSIFKTGEINSRNRDHAEQLRRIEEITARKRTDADQADTLAKELLDLPLIVDGDVLTSETTSVRGHHG